MIEEGLLLPMSVLLQGQNSAGPRIVVLKIQ